MDIDTGKMVALAGVSGCGKTTLLNILGLLDMDYTGSVEIDDGEISGDMKNKVFPLYVRLFVSKLCVS